MVNDEIILKYEILHKNVLYWDDLNYFGTFHFSTLNKDGSDNYRIFKQKLHICPQDFCKKCNYQSHPYLMWKSFNVVRITLA